MNTEVEKREVKMSLSICELEDDTRVIMCT
jgi:hypothetical protein